MTYAFTYEVPIDTDIYARIKDGIGPERAPGMIAHLAYRTETWDLRYVDVWQSKEDWERIRARPPASRRPRAAEGDPRVRAARAAADDA